MSFPSKENCEGSRGCEDAVENLATVFSGKIHRAIFGDRVKTFPNGGFAKRPL